MHDLPRPSIPPLAEDDLHVIAHRRARLHSQRRPDAAGKGSQRRKEVSGGIYVPNVLAPTGSVHNQRFTVYAAAGTVERVEWLRVYDRWGGLVFEGKNLTPSDESAGWDGIWHGQPVQPGAYIWQAEIRLTGGEVLRKSGDVTVVE